MKKKTPYKNALRSQKLIKLAYVQLMMQKNINKITITDIVRQADINRGTFYAHFLEPKDVLKIIYTELLANIKNYLQLINESNGATLKRYLYETTLYLETQQDFIRASLETNYSFLLKDIKQLFNEILNSNTTTLNSFICGGVISLYHDWFSNYASGSIADLSNQIYNYTKGFKQTTLT